MKITIKRIVDRGSAYWQVRVWRNGRYERKQFVLREDAQAYRDQLEGKVSEAKQVEVPEMDRHAVWAAYERARKEGYSLTQSCDTYERQLSMKVVKVTAEDAVKLFMAIKVAKRLRARSLENLKYRLGRFVSVIKPSTTLDAVTLEDLHRCLDRKWSPRSVINFRLAMVNFLAWAKKQNHVLENVAENIEKPLTDNLPPIILTPIEVREFLDRTRSIHPELIPYVSISLFAGLRNKEMSLLEWGDIKEGVVEISSHKAKTRQRRAVDIQPNLRAWLDLGGDLPIGSFRKRWVKIKPDRWEIDCMRRTFCSYHLAKFQSASQTAMQAGHRESVLFSHYRGLVSNQDADAFWSIFP